MNNLKNSYSNLKRNSLMAILATGVAISAAACAATPTQESTGGYVDDSTITAKVKTDRARFQGERGDVSVKTSKASSISAALLIRNRKFQKPGSSRVK